MEVYRRKMEGKWRCAWMEVYRSDEARGRRRSDAANTAALWRSHERRALAGSEQSDDESEAPRKDRAIQGTNGYLAERVDEQ